MDWNALGALAETIAAVAVLATLIHLSWQLRNYRDEQQRSIQSYRQSVLREFFMESIRSPILNEAIREARDHMDLESSSAVLALQEKCGLGPEKAVALASFYLAQCLNRIETIQNLHLLSDEQRVNFEGQLVANYLRPGPEQVWFTAYRGNAGIEMPIFKLVDSLGEESLNGGA